MFISDHIGTTGAYEKLTPAAATSISAAILSPATGEFAGRSAVAAFITVESFGINFTLDGSTPTAAAGTNVGHQLAVNESLLLRGKRVVKQFKCIDRVAGSASAVKVTTYF